MTVKELIEKLQKCDGDKEVRIYKDGSDIYVAFVTEWAHTVEIL